MPELIPFGLEPAVEGWSTQSWVALLGDILPDPRPAGRPVIVAVDGHSGSGKSTAAQRLAAVSPGAVIVHTDDAAWWESYFGWDELLRDGILRPARNGESVSFRPPAWDRRGRTGSIDIPSGTTLVIVEGVGASRRTLNPYLDASVWVQSDYDEATRRGIARDAAQGQGPEFWWEWMAEENPFLMDDRPWERATAVVCGTPDVLGIDHDPERQVVRGHIPARS